LVNLLEIAGISLPMTLNTPALPTKANAFVPPVIEFPKDFFSQAKCRFTRSFMPFCYFFFAFSSGCISLRRNKPSDRAAIP